MKRIAFFLPNLHGGGAERIAVNLLKGLLEEELCLDLILACAEGPYLNEVPKQVRVIDLEKTRVVQAVLPLARYLRQYKPYALISHLSHANVAAMLSEELARTSTRLVLVEHENLSASKSRLFKAKFIPLLMKWLYPHAEAIVSVSKGIAQDLQSQLNLEEGKISTIYNPVVDEGLIAKAKAPLDHPWFQEGEPPVFLAVGRLTEQKDFLTLVQAFASLRQRKPARLVILGEGESRSELEGAIRTLGITEDVSMPGFVENPYAYMYRVSALVLSSRWEALPTVLIEALACGCPGISTDCPFGPKEILEAGKYGALVSVGDVEALSSAMLDVLEVPPNREMLIHRSQDFSTQRSVRNYLTLLGCV